MPDEDDPVGSLSALLGEYDPAVASLAQHVLARIDALLAGAHRMVYDNCNATVVGYSPDGKARHAVCSVAAYPRWVNLFFFAGSVLPDHHGLLQGTGSTVRSVRLAAPGDFDGRVVDLIGAAVAMSEVPFDADRPLSTEIVSRATRRRTRRPPPPAGSGATT
jgi:hypothetical protein